MTGVVLCCKVDTSMEAREEELDVSAEGTSVMGRNSGRAELERGAVVVLAVEGTGARGGEIGSVVALIEKWRSSISK